MRVATTIGKSDTYLTRKAWWAIPVGWSALPSGRLGADDAGISIEQETVCESCGQLVADPSTLVVIPTSDGQKIVRHRRCHMLELLDRA